MLSQNDFGRLQRDKGEHFMSLLVLHSLSTNIFLALVANFYGYEVCYSAINQALTA